MGPSTSLSSDPARVVDALVVGAGPAGSATAAWLARAGYRVVAVDRAAFPREKPCSEYMSPAVIELLDRLGVVPSLVAAGAAELDGAAVTAPRGSRLHGLFALAAGLSHPTDLSISRSRRVSNDRAGAAEAGTQEPMASGFAAGAAVFRPTGLSISRRVLDEQLVAAARVAGAEVWERTAVEELLYDHGAVAGAVLREADGRRRVLRARLTVGADGLRSVVARRIGGRTYGRPRRLAFVAHMDGVADMGRSAELHVGTRGYVGLNRIEHGRTNVALVVPAARASDARGRAEAFFFDTLGEFPEVRRRVDQGRLEREVLVTGPFAAWSRRVVVDGAALVGDAADFFDPFTGEGIYSALRGAELLARHATAALTSPGPITAAALAGYRRARRRAFAGKWAVERMIGYGMWFPRWFDRAVARLGRRGAMAHTLIGVTGDLVPARAVLNPLFLARMVL